MPKRKCCVPGCINSLDTNAILYEFPNPTKDKEFFNTWVYSVGGDKLQIENEHIFKYRRVCRVFEQKYCCRNNRLSKEAVPTKNMPEPVTQLDSVDMKPHTQSAIEDIQTKENLKLITSPSCDTVSREFVPMHATITVEDVQSKKNLEHHQKPTLVTKRRVKRVAVTQSKHALIEYKI